MKTLSKSRFVSGIQCDKKLWFDCYRKDLKLPPEDSTQTLFDLGNRIGKLAQKMFPNGEDASPVDFSDFNESIVNTKNWISKGVENIYEATFCAKNAFCMLDILHRHNNELWAIEVKNSTSVKDYHLIDASLQYFVMNEAGYPPNQFFLMHVNNQYIKCGEINHEFFVLENITEMVLAKQAWVKDNLEKFLNLLEQKHEPAVSIGKHCSIPFGCEYAHHCWNHIPQNSVFELYKGGKKSWELYENGIFKIEDINSDFPLTHFQNLQKNGLINKYQYIDKVAIKNLISNWKFPLYFFDFETIFSAIPVLDGSRPYQQVPFQYSLHILDDEGKISHKEFLANPQDFSNGNNPLKVLVSQLKKDFGKQGNIVTYNQSFEIGRLNDLIKIFPDDAPFLYNLVDRVVDLLPVFRGGHCYFPEMKNSASIKSVLPAIAPDFNYQNLEIQDGGTAGAIYLHAIENKGFIDDDVSGNLLKYCELDTYAMLVIYKFLMKMLHN